MKYIINQNSIVLFINNKIHKVSKESDVYASVISKFDLPENERESAILEVLNPNKTQDAENKGFIINDDEVTYQGEKLPKSLSKKVVRLYNENLPLELFENFWKNLKQNPSSQSVNELYEFLEYKELPLTEDGCFLAYKGVRHDMYSSSGNLDTKVISGTVDSQGKILNNIGETITVERNNVDDDRNVHCSFGLHVGSLDYARSFAPVVLVVKVNPKDVVSVPTDHFCQKCRVSSYTVESIFEKEIVHAVVDQNNQPIQSEIVKKINQETQEYSLFKERINNYLLKKRENNESEVSIRKIQNIFSPEYPSKEKIISVLNDLGWIWLKINDGYIVYL
jgi:predicted metal-binding transcription factor (methanogenesis marker protein 9)